MTPGLTVGPGDLGEMVVTFNITDPDYTYHLWRSTSPAATPDEKLDTATEDDGVYSDTFEIEGGFIYCYMGAVEKDGVLSALSGEICNCAVPNAVSDLSVIASNESSLTIQWTNPSGNFSHTNVKVNDLETNVTMGDIELVTASVSFTLTDNTPYTITATLEPQSFIHIAISKLPGTWEFVNIVRIL